MKCTCLGDIPLLRSSALTSIWRMLFGALIAIVLPLRSWMVRIGEPAGTMITWLRGCMIDPAASISKSSWLTASARM